MTEASFPTPTEVHSARFADVSLRGAPMGRYLGTKSTSANVYLGIGIRSSSNKKTT